MNAAPPAAVPQQKQLYRLPVILLPEADGSFSALAVTLPGAASQGETEVEALANIAEAIAGCLEVYQEQGRLIPWRTGIPEQNEPAALGRWVEVYA
ncbi:MAG: type II toxin-antitoxin system HicB family antitoxin [Gemmataceae bacterium]|nr:type II toxin-antitoxin system HicB family antitoxin [Gemmataceae bacterium]